MSGTLSAVTTSVTVSGLNYTIIAVVALIAVAALGVAWVLAREVLAASEGTDNMRSRGLSRRAPRRTSPASSARSRCSP